MRNFTRLLFTGLMLMLFSNFGIAQQSQQFTSYVGKLIRTTPRLADIDKNSMYGAPLIKTRDEHGIIGHDEEEEEERPIRANFGSKVLKDMGLQGSYNTNTPSPNSVTASANIIQNFDGLTATGFAPSDNNLAVGPNHVVQIINHSSGSLFKIWNKSGTQVQAQTILSTITGLAGAGDPVVMYDQIADRWILTEFSNTNDLRWAVSTTSDPTGSYKIYSYNLPFFPDYPHYSVWHNAYYGITHDFPSSYIGSSVYAFDRAAMIAGAATATMVRFQFNNSLGSNVANRAFTMLPVHQEGPAVSNQSGLFTFFQDDSETPDPLDKDSVFTFTYTPDFITPANSVIGPLISVLATPFNSTLCGVAACVTQPSGGPAIRGIEGQIMHKVGYRNFGAYESMVANFTTNNGAGIGAIRWWEMRRIGGAGNWSMYQEGTYSPADGNHRFMGSIAQNALGDIGLIFNVTGPGTPPTFPSFRLTGRTTCDPLGQMTIPETSIMEGTVINGTNRMGDYNALQTDPTGNTFWGTGQYNATGFGTFGNWATRVVNFSISGGAAQITSQPASSSVCAGTTATFSVTANGGGTLNYKWQVSTNSGGTWTDIAGATAAIYSFTAVAGDNGKQFRCIIGSSACALTATSNAATLTITTFSQGGTVTASNANACAGPNSTTLTLTGSIGNIIRWESSIDNFATAGTVIANTTTTLTVTNITQTTYYRALVQSSGCSAAYSTTATITFVAAGVGNLTITADNGTTLCAGDPTLLTALTAPTPGTASASSGPITVGIPDNNVTGVSTSLNIAGVPPTAIGSSASVTFNITHTWDGDVTLFLKAPNNQVLNLVNQRGGSADNFVNTVISSTATTPIASGVAPFTGTFLPDGDNSAPPPAGFSPTATTFTPLINTAGQLNGTWSLGARDLANGDVGTITSWGLTLNYGVPAGPPAGATYVWSPAAGLNATNTNPVAASPNTTTTYTVVATNGSGCTGTGSITITVRQRPAVTAQPANTSVCAGLPATFNVTATGTGIAYQWQESTNGGVSYTSLNNAAPYSGVNTPTLTINPTAALLNSNRYRCVITGVCTPAANSNGALLTIKALPIVPITPPGPICGGVAGVNGVLLSAGSSAPPVPGTATISSGTISVPVADNAPAGASSNLTVALPVNATITGVRVTFNMPHTYCGDMSFNLKAPNGQILNLDRNLTGTGNQAGVYPNTGFVNTIISSTGTVALSTANVQPLSGTFKADAINNTITPGYSFADPTGFVANAASFANLYSVPNGVWTLAMADNGAGDVGTLTSWSLIIDYTTPGASGSPLTFTWAPVTGLYTNATATTAYAGTPSNNVYAAPTAFTAYTVSGTDATTGCIGRSTVLVNYTPPAPTVTPNPVAMCLGDAAVKLKSSSSTATTVSFPSGTVHIPILDANPAGTAPTSLNITGIPAGATISSVSVTLNVTHTYIADMTFNLKAPNGQVLNLDKNMGATGNPGANFTNTVISSAGTAALSGGTQPYTATFKADLINGGVTPGYTYGDPTGYAATAPNWGALYSVPNGTWTLAGADDGAGDVGFIENWTLNITYVLGVPARPAVWSPIAGLFSDAAATTAYVAGTEVDSVWAKPTPSGVYPFQATVNSLPPAPATVSMTNNPTTFFATLTFNVRNNNNYAVTLTNISSMCNVTGATNVSAYYKASAINGLPGAITVANGWNQFGSATITSIGFPNVQPFMSGLNLVIPANTTYGILISAILPSGTTNLVFSNTGTNLIASAGGCDIITGPNIGYTGPAVPGAPTFTPYHFIGSIGVVPSIPACTSPARTVTVTVNQPISITAQPLNAVVCTDKVTSFTVAAAGTTPTYQWQVSTDNGNNFTNVSNGGVYAGATTATLTITAPPVSMSNYVYRCMVSGAAPCASVPSATRSLIVNPLPTVKIAASPYQKLFPGLRTTLFSTVTPAATTYTWLRNGLPVSGTASSLLVGIDGLGDYTLRVTDVNGCTNTSNLVSLTDSVSGRVFIYPTPNGGQFQVRYYSIINNTSLPRGVNVYDARGKRLITQTYSISAPYARMDVDLRNHGTGVYWVEVVDVSGNRLAMGRTEVLR